MFGFGKKTKQDRAKQEVLSISNRAVEDFNRTLDRWRLTSLEMRRTMLEDAFAERVLEIEPSDGNSFQFIAEIEALALMQNWAAGEEKYAAEFFKMLDADTLAILQTIGADERIGEEVGGRMHATGVTMNENIDDLVRQAVLRRGEVPE